jgi:hypothetical protein
LAARRALTSAISEYASVATRGLSATMEGVVSALALVAASKPKTTSKNKAAIFLMLLFR